MAVITNPQQEAPGVESGLYDSEQGSDVTFVAGIENDTWRFPGHRAILAAANQVFNAMLCGPLSYGDDVIYIKDVEKRAFGQLLRYLYGHQVSLPSVATARATLEAAHEYICPGLVRECVNYLDNNLDATTVLEVYQNLRYFCTRIIPPSSGPTAPSLHALSDVYSQAEDNINEPCDCLFTNCILFIDDNADAVFQQERIEELCYEDLAILVQRDTLNITSEIDFFQTLSRWGKSECKRNKKELTPANRRQVLGPLSYCVRYLLMTEKEFIAGPQASELIDLTECRMILARMRGNKTVTYSKQQEELLRRFATPRKVDTSLQPNVLSERSAKGRRFSMSQCDNDNAGSKKKNKKKNKKESKKKEKNDPDPKEKKTGCSCSCFGESLLRAFVCIFD